MCCASWMTVLVSLSLVVDRFVFEVRTHCLPRVEVAGGVRLGNIAPEIVNQVLGDFSDPNARARELGKNIFMVIEQLDRLDSALRTSRMLCTELMQLLLVGELADRRADIAWGSLVAAMALPFGAAPAPLGLGVPPAAPAAGGLGAAPAPLGLGVPPDAPAAGLPGGGFQLGGAAGLQAGVAQMNLG